MVRPEDMPAPPSVAFSSSQNHVAMLARNIGSSCAWLTQTTWRYPGQALRHPGVSAGSPVNMSGIEPAVLGVDGRRKSGE
jgi:hypothetical protein